MRRTGTIRESDVGKDPLKIMMEHTERPHYVHGPSFLVSPTQSLPTREKMVADCMAIPEYTPRWVDGKYTQGEPSYWSREKAERSADAFFADYERWERRVAASCGANDRGDPAGSQHPTASRPFPWTGTDE